MILVAFLKKKSKRWFMKVNSLKTKIKSSGRKSTPRTSLRTIASRWRTPSMTKSWKRNSLTRTKRLSRTPLTRECNFSKATKTPTLKTTRPSRKNSSLSSILLCRKSIKMLKKQEKVWLMDFNRVLRCLQAHLMPKLMTLTEPEHDFK